MCLMPIWSCLPTVPFKQCPSSAPWRPDLHPEISKTPSLLPPQFAVHKAHCIAPRGWRPRLCVSSLVSDPDSSSMTGLPASAPHSKSSLSGHYPIPPSRTGHFAQSQLSCPHYSWCIPYCGGWGCVIYTTALIIWHLQ